QSAAEFRQALIGAGTGPILPGQPLQANAGPSFYRPSVSTQITPSTTLAFDSDILREVAAELANHMGPIAGVLVKSIAKKAVSLSHLIELSAAEIPDDKARESFIKKFSMIPKTTPKSSPGASAKQSAPATTDATVLVPTGARLNTAMLARAEAALAKHIGAVAKVVVSRAAKKARDAAELYLIIADEIEDKEERKAFVRKAIAARVDIEEN
ncbi:MAG: hypothetical protein ACXU7H_05910, partial [Burkholderiaceae bacterium]